MGKRKEAELLDADKQRDAMLSGIKDKAAIQLYDEAMAQLEQRDQATFAAALQLRDAVQWTVTINEIQSALSSALRSYDPEEKRIAQLIKHKQAAEDARRRILDGLLLTPQKPRGRPPKGEKTAEDDTPEDDGWDDFGKTASDGGFEDDDGS